MNLEQVEAAMVHGIIAAQLRPHLDAGGVVLSEENDVDEHDNLVKRFVILKPLPAHHILVKLDCRVQRN